MDSFEELTRLLDELGVRWATAGAVAANKYRSSPRLTEDTDLLVEWNPRLLDRMQALGWDLTVAADRGEPPHLIRARKSVSVDLLVALTDYQAIALSRARDNWLTVEDVIVHKLIAGRPRDIDDLSSILSTGITIDEGYVSEWATAWEVGDLWDTLRNSEP